VFWRTFAALALPVLLAVQALDWATEENYKANALIFGLGLLGALVGAVVAVLLAVAFGLAATPLGKSLRAALEAVAQVLSGLAFTSASDLPKDVDLLVAGVPIVIFAFLVAFFQNQGAVPNVGSVGASGKSALKDAFTRESVV
jgi:4-amino-4-deoxy-L-arabinose transferase-like glycosyltransferase